MPLAASPALAPLWGALVGDALGVPFEFKTAGQLPAARDIDMAPPAAMEGFEKSYPAVPYGTWSDDGSQVLCLADYLNHLDDAPLAFEPSVFAQYLLAWRDQAFHQAGGRVFDIGGQTQRALQAWLTGRPATGVSLSHANGNGSLMRAVAVPVIAALKDWSDEAMVALACRQSAVTHPAPQSLACCALYSVLVRHLMEGQAVPDGLAGWKSMVARAADDVKAMQPSVRAAIDEVMLWGDRELPSGHGFVINTFWSAIYAMTLADNYSDAARQAIALGGDTDTTACVAGGLAGAAWGLAGHKGVPMRWLQALSIPVESHRLMDALSRQVCGAPRGPAPNRVGC